jgi:outer membrane protein assembly factor BamB
MPKRTNWNTPVYGDGKFVATAFSGNTVAISTDGINWKTEYRAIEQDKVDSTEDIGNLIVESKNLVSAPTNATAGDLLMYNGTNWTKISKADLIAEIIAALPSAEEASF